MSQLQLMWQGVKILLPTYLVFSSGNFCPIKKRLASLQQMFYKVKVTENIKQKDASTDFLHGQQTIWHQPPRSFAEPPSRNVRQS
jgi:hypothetical protein